MTTPDQRAATALVALLFVLAPRPAAAQQADTDTAAPPPAAKAETADTTKPADSETEPASTDPTVAPAPPALPAAEPAPAATSEPAAPAKPTRPPVFAEELEEELPPPQPPISRGFVPGTHEAALGLATAGSGDYFYFGASALYAYYVVKGLAPGIEVQYAHIFSDEDYPDAMSLMPFLKYAFTMSETVAPYLLLGGGRQFEWGVDESFHKADSWFLSGGIGAHIGLGEQWAIKIQVLFNHHWYDGTKVYQRPDKEFFKDGYGEQVWCGEGETCDSPTAENVRYSDDPPSTANPAYCDSDFVAGSKDPAEQEKESAFIGCMTGRSQLCDASTGKCRPIRSDAGDKKREWIYPVITFGLSYVF